MLVSLSRLEMQHLPMLVLVGVYALELYTHQRHDEILCAE